MPPPNSPQPAAHPIPIPPSIAQHPPPGTPYFNTILNTPTSAQQPPAPTPFFEPGERPHAEFSAAQRSLQARAKDYNAASKNATQGGAQRVSSGGVGGAKRRDKEDYEVRMRRERAAGVLDSMEILMWYANSRNESISQTRRHFQNIVLGIEDGRDVLWREEWEVPRAERVDEERERGASVGASGGKGKEREKRG